METKSIKKEEGVTLFSEEENIIKNNNNPNGTNNDNTNNSNDLLAQCENKNKLSYSGAGE